MKKKVVWIVIVSVLMSNVAWAQDTKPTPESCAEAQKYPGTYPYLKAACDRVQFMNLYPAEDALERRKTRLIGGGGLLMIVGGAMIAGGGTTYHIFGDDYCVTDYSVDAGSCFNPMMARIGLATLGVGLVMIIIGSKITVNPQISKSGAGAAVTVKWGGKK